jgi:hypothetical protein
LYETGATVDQVYFPTGAVISLVVGLSTGEMIEAAMVGRDGVVAHRLRWTGVSRSAAPSFSLPVARWSAR